MNLNNSHLHFCFWLYIILYYININIAPTLYSTVRIHFQPPVWTLPFFSLHSPQSFKVETSYHKIYRSVPCPRSYPVHI